MEGYELPIMHLFYTIFVERMSTSVIKAAISEVTTAEENASSLRLAINPWPCYGISHMIRVSRNSAINKTVLLSTRGNIFCTPPNSPPTAISQDTRLMASFTVPKKRDVIFIFMRSRVPPPASFLPFWWFTYLTRFKDKSQLHLCSWMEKPSSLLVALNDPKLQSVIGGKR